MRPLDDALLDAVCEMGGDPGRDARDALMRRLGPGSAWHRAPSPPDARAWCPCHMGQGALACRGCGCRECRPCGTSLLMEVCAELWPWAAEAIFGRDGSGRAVGAGPDLSPYGEDGEIYY